MTGDLTIDIEHLRSWIGRQEHREDVLSVAVAQALAATLDRESVPTAGEALPPLWHWAHFTPLARQSELGIDGHPRLGGFLPPVPLPRRMWAGGRLRFLRDLAIGSAVRRITRISDVRLKTGRQGALVFLTLVHQVNDVAGTVIEEEQDIVYRTPVVDPSSSPPAKDADRRVADWQEELVPSAALLFRYSALTFNAHRIHYDLPYAQHEEGYPGLVVQGPLTATLLMDRALRWTGQRPNRFTFRGESPLFVDERLMLYGRRYGERLSLWAEDSSGRRAMTAEADFSEAA